jgi:GTP-binding protein HflX
LLHVIDVSSANWREQALAVDDILVQLDVNKTPTIAVYNKTDLLAAGTIERVPDLPGHLSVPISAKTGEGLSALIQQVMGQLESFAVEVELKIPYTKAGVLSRIHDHGKILDEVYESDGVRINAVIPRSTARSLSRFLLPK